MQLARPRRLVGTPAERRADYSAAPAESRVTISPNLCLCMYEPRVVHCSFASAYLLLPTTPRSPESYLSRTSCRRFVQAVTPRRARRTCAAEGLRSAADTSLLSPGLCVRRAGPLEQANSGRRPVVEGSHGCYCCAACSRSDPFLAMYLASASSIQQPHARHAH